MPSPMTRTRETRRITRPRPRRPETPGPAANPNFELGQESCNRSSRRTCYPCHGNEGSEEGGFNYVLEPTAPAGDQKRLFPAIWKASKIYQPHVRRRNAAGRSQATAQLARTTWPSSSNGLKQALRISAPPASSRATSFARPKCSNSSGRTSKCWMKATASSRAISH